MIHSHYAGVQTYSIPFLLRKHLIRRMLHVDMDKLKVYLMRAGKAFEGTTTEVCEEIVKQIDSDLVGLSKETPHDVQLI